jgi:hypothetical protein
VAPRERFGEEVEGGLDVFLGLGAQGAIESEDLQDRRACMVKDQGAVRLY